MKFPGIGFGEVLTQIEIEILNGKEEMSYPLLDRLRIPLQTKCGDFFSLEKGRRGAVTLEVYLFPSSALRKTV